MYHVEPIANYFNRIGILRATQSQEKSQRTISSELGLDVATESRQSTVPPAIDVHIDAAVDSVVSWDYLGSSMRRDHFNTFFAQFFIAFVAVIGMHTNQNTRLRFNRVELKTVRHQREFIVSRRMGADRQSQYMTIYNSHAWSVKTYRHYHG